MKEDENLPIIFGGPLLSSTRALDDIHDSIITLHVEDKAITFEMSPKVCHEKPKDEVSKTDDMEEDLSELEEIEKMTEEELKVWRIPMVKKSKVQNQDSQFP